MKINDIPFKVGKEFGYTEDQIREAFKLSPIEDKLSGNKEVTPEVEAALTEFLRSLFSMQTKDLIAVRDVLESNIKERHKRN